MIEEIDLERHIKDLKRKVELLEEIRDLRRKIEELESPYTVWQYIPWYHPTYPYPPITSPWITYGTAGDALEKPSYEIR